MRVGQIVDNRFRIDRLIGRGGAGIVYQGWDLRHASPVAVKVSRWPDDVGVQRFMREAEALSRLRHPGVVGYLAHGLVAAGVPYLAMEWLDGEDLGRRLAREPLSVPETVAVGLQVAEALTAAHDLGIIHRDIKPGNLFLVGGDTGKVKLLDFGLARVPSLENGVRPLTHNGQLLGTPGFIAPEQARGRSDLDERVDLYSLGVVLFTCLSQKPPFLASHFVNSLAPLLFEAVPHIRELRADVPEPLDSLIIRLMDRKRDRREQSARAVIAHLRHIHRLGRARPIALPSARAMPGASGPRFWSLLVIDGDERRVARSQVTAIARQYRARLVPLPSREATVLLYTDRDLTSAATRAARCALALRAACPDVPLALATGRGATRVRDIGRAVGVWRLQGKLGDARSTSAPGPLANLSVATLTSRPLSGELSFGSVSDELLSGQFEALAAPLPAIQRQPSRAQFPAPRFERCEGRVQELDQLEQTIARCAIRSQARFLVVYGEPGIGKSQLRRALSRRLERRGDAPTMWLAHGDQLQSSSPLAVLGRLIRCGFGLAPSHPVAEHQRRLSERLCRALSVEDAERVAVFLGHLLGGSLVDDNHPILRAARRDLRGMHEQLARALGDWLDAETSRRPVVIAIDDAQWSDDASLRLLRRVITRLADRPLMVVAFARPPEDGVAPIGLRDADTMVLTPLSSSVCKALAWRALPGASDEYIRELAVRSAGNALYLEELVRSAARDRRADLPTSVRCAIIAHLGRLNPRERQVIGAASALGAAFSPDGVAAMVECDHAEACAIIGRLVRHGLVGRVQRHDDCADADYSFRSPWLRELVYLGLTQRERERWHQRAGAWLESQDNADGAAIAEHLQRSDTPERAVPWLCVAAERALLAGEYNRALDLTRRAVTWDASEQHLGAISLIQAEAYNCRGQRDAAYLCACNAMDLLRRGSPAWNRAALHVVSAASGVERPTDLATVREVAQVRDTVPLDAGGTHLIDAMVGLSMDGDWSNDIRVPPRQLVTSDTSQPASPL